ncbi:MAG TPA: GPR endopeptidase [Clostridiales bacterium]|nr:GPR endopeptidase [Clostridiales bacterium]HBR08243.1 GPR endopeptidase [Clostridiales bacterium]
MERKIRTDLAVEQRELVRGSAAETTELPGVRAREDMRKGYKVTTVDVLDEEGSKALCKPVGRYTTIELDALIQRAENAFVDAAELLAELLREVLRPDMGAGTLVAGLGNDAITPDALGPLAIESVMATRHLKSRMPEQFEAFRPVAAVRTGVLGSTGIESAEVLRAICESISPSRVVAIDALASGSLDRLCRTIQITDVGIVPGSGVGNNRAELCERTLGVPVVAIGVPTVVDAAVFSDEESAKGMFVTPRDIDSSVRDTAKLIGYGINLAMHDGLTIGDVDMFLS